MKMPNNVKGILKKVKNHLPLDSVFITHDMRYFRTRSHIESEYRLSVIDEKECKHWYPNLTFDELKQKASDIIDGNI